MCEAFFHRPLPSINDFDYVWISENSFRKFAKLKTNLTIKYASLAATLFSWSSCANLTSLPANISLINPFLPLFARLCHIYKEVTAWIGPISTVSIGPYSLQTSLEALVFLPSSPREKILETLRRKGDPPMFSLSTASPVPEILSNTNKQIRWNNVFSNCHS